MLSFHFKNIDIWYFLNLIIFYSFPLLLLFILSGRSSNIFFRFIFKMPYAILYILILHIQIRKLSDFFKNVNFYCLIYIIFCPYLILLFPYALISSLHIIKHMKRKNSERHLYFKYIEEREKLILRSAYGLELLLLPILILLFLFNRCSIYCLISHCGLLIVEFNKRSMIYNLIKEFVYFLKELFFSVAVKKEKTD